MNQYTAHSIKDLEQIADDFIKNHLPKRLFALEGEMGVGKTTFVGALCKQLGVTDVVNSPTFSIVNEYLIPDGRTIYHFDFYRIKEPEEALSIGLEEYLYGDGICLMEWSERIEPFLPEDLVMVKFTETANKARIITVL